MQLDRFDILIGTFGCIQSNTVHDDRIPSVTVYYQMHKMSIDPIQTALYCKRNTLIERRLVCVVERACL